MSHLSYTRDPELFNLLLNRALDRFVALLKPGIEESKIRARYRPEIVRCELEAASCRSRWNTDSYAVMGWADWLMEKRILIAERNREIAELRTLASATLGEAQGKTRATD